MTTQPTTIGTTHHGRLPRQWFRTVLRDYHSGQASHGRFLGRFLCHNSAAFHLAWSDDASRDYLCKLAQRFCASHKDNYGVGNNVLFYATDGFVTNDELIAVRTAFLRWCIASSANRTA